MLYDKLQIQPYHFMHLCLESLGSLESLINFINQVKLPP